MMFLLESWGGLCFWGNIMHQPNVQQWSPFDLENNMVSLSNGFMPSYSISVCDGVAFSQVKGQMYGNSFHPDPEIYMANQHIAFGPPEIAASGIPIPAAS